MTRAPAPHPARAPAQMPVRLRIGSRPSALALAQAGIVRSALAALIPGLDSEIVRIKTTGDRMTARLAGECRRQGALHQGAGAGAGGSPNRYRRSFDEGSSRHAGARIQNRRGARARRPARRAGDSSRAAALTLCRALRASGPRRPRRKFEAMRLRPDLIVSPLRGNVDTRLERLAKGELDGVILAIAGLKRLSRLDGLNHHRAGRTRVCPGGRAGRPRDRSG